MPADPAAAAAADAAASCANNPDDDVGTCETMSMSAKSSIGSVRSIMSATPAGGTHAKDPSDSVCDSWVKDGEDEADEGKGEMVSAGGAWTGKDEAS